MSKLPRVGDKFAPANGARITGTSIYGTVGKSVTAGAVYWYPMSTMFTAAEGSWYASSPTQIPDPTRGRAGGGSVAVATSKPSSGGSASGGRGNQSRGASRGFGPGAPQRYNAKPVSKRAVPAGIRSKAPGAKACHLIACPDELSQVGPTELPVVPTASSACRYEHIASMMDNFYLRNSSMIANIPGQTSYAVRVGNSATIGSLAPGALVMLNMGSSNLMWSSVTAGISATLSAQRTVRLVPDYHLGFIASCDTVKVLPPVPVVFTVTAGGPSVFYPIFDGTNYFFATLANEAGAQVVATIIGEVILQNAVLVQGTTVPPFTPAGLVTAGVITQGLFQTANALMDIQPLVPTSGGPVRSMLQLNGPVLDRPADNTFFPNYTVACNLRVESGQAATAASGSLQSYAIGAGADGPYNAVVGLTGTATYGSVAPSWADIGARARQHSMGMLNPSNSEWYAANLASRLGGSTDLDAPVIADFSCISLRDVPDSYAASSAIPAQDASFAGYPFNTDLMGWGHRPTVSLTCFNTGNLTGSTTYPISIEAWVWLEAHVNADVGLHVQQPMYVPEFVNWLQILNSYPVMARADSFKDFLSGLWREFKAGAGFVGRRVRGVAVSMLRDAAVEGLILAAVATL